MQINFCLLVAQDGTPDAQFDTHLMAAVDTALFKSDADIALTPDALRHLAEHGIVSPVMITVHEGEQRVNYYTNFWIDAPPADRADLLRGHFGNLARGFAAKQRSSL